MSRKVAPSSPSPRRILSASYLENCSKNELVRRLRTIADILRNNPTVEPDSPDFPGLASLASCLVPQFLENNDKDVRMYTVLCCMELFTLYAPQAPWNEHEIYSIFEQTIRQLANLAHTTSPSQTNYENYFRILELLATVKIGIVLVDLAQNDGDMNLLEQDTQQSSQQQDNPLELLCELFRTLLQSLRNQHPPLVAESVQRVISSCLEEYDGGRTAPLPLVEEILICIGQPRVLVPNTAALQPAATVQMKAGKKRKQPPPPQLIEEPNPSYIVAAAVIRKHLDNLSFPVSTLLNGLLNGEAHIVQRSSIVAADEEKDEVDNQNNQAGVDVWEIIFQLGRVAPKILTTILVNVSTCLESPETSKREKAVKLLGKLFYAKGSKLAVSFAACFRRWLGRCNDNNPKIRIFLTHSLVAILRENIDHEVVKECDAALVGILLCDQALEVRLEALHDVCDFVFESRKDQPLSLELLEAVGNRVKSKDSEERKAALTGLARIYTRHYMQDLLRKIQNAGDDWDIKTVSQVLRQNCSNADVFNDDQVESSVSFDVEERSKYRWIASRIFECLFYTDAQDPVMRNNLFKFIDDLILGSSLSKNPNKNLTPTARSVGLVVLIDSLRKPGESVWGENDTTNAFKFMQDFFRRRVMLQRALGKYIDARSRIREYRAGTEEALAADAAAMEKLKTLVALVPPQSGSVGEILELHFARDKHIFRILSSLTDPKHGVSTRIRALDELPKRTKSLGDAVSAWVSNLVRRCSMGDFLNAAVVQHCVFLANKAFAHKDIPSTLGFLSCVKIAIGIFPNICDDVKSFATLKDLFSSCTVYLSGKANAELKGQIEKNRMMTHLSSILTAVAQRMKDATAEEPQSEAHRDERLRKQLIQVCTKDGTPMERHNAVETLVSLFSMDDPKEGNGIFSLVLGDLTSPSKMNVNSAVFLSEQMVSILSALTALVERAPFSFIHSPRGGSAVRFAFDILQGRSSGSSDDVESDEDDKTPPRSRLGSTKHCSPDGETCLLENPELSVPCRRLCACIEFLGAYVRSFTTLAVADSNEENDDTQDVEPSTEDAQEDAKANIEREIKALFGVLAQLIRDHGVPASNRDRKECRARQEQAAIRQCAAIQLLRLCDSNLGLEDKYLTNHMWHILSSIFLDEEKVVRQAVIEELIAMMTGTGIFRSRGGASAPGLRFVALVALCVDGDRGSGHSRANGNAANVGRVSVEAQMAARRCVCELRKACGAVHPELNAKTGARDQVPKDQTEKISLRLMPEYIVPYVFHLLSYRRETPAREAPSEKSTGNNGRQNRQSNEETSAAQHKMLKKRLKMLFEPLILTLGDSADNISFLLRMTASLSTHVPVNVAEAERSVVSSSESPLGRLSLDSDLVSPQNNSDGPDSILAQAKLNVVCAEARNVLDAFVKKDINLAEHPGDAMRIPAFLFEKPDKTPARKIAPFGNANQSVEKDQTPISRLSGELRFSPGLSPIRKNQHDSDDEKMTDVETPASARQKDDGAEQIPRHEDPRHPLLSDETTPDDRSTATGDSDFSGQNMKEAAQEPRPVRNQKGTGRERWKSPIKPLGASNRARTAEMRSTEKSPARDNKRPRRSLRNRPATSNT